MTDRGNVSIARLEIGGVAFVKTSLACPEQWNGFVDGKAVVYVRTRYGELTAKMYSPKGDLLMSEEIYSHSYYDMTDRDSAYLGWIPPGDLETHLEKIAAATLQALKKRSGS